MNIKYKNNENVFELIESHGVPYFEYPMLNGLGMVKHGFSTRLGGVSEGIFSSMNLSFTRGDQNDAVAENFTRMAKAISVKKESMVASNQTHTTNVIVVKEEHKGNGIIRPNELEDIDGFITNIPGICLATFYADCVPLYFVDSKKMVIGLSHSGWKGTVDKIGAVTIQKMKEEFGSNSDDIYVAIGPSICQNCYEVSEDVIEQFQNAYKREDWDSLFYKKENGKYQLDLWKANELILLESGILKEHIAITNVCTCCNSDILFSHRASQGKRGNLGAFLAIKEECYE